MDPVDEKILDRVVAGRSYMAVRMTGFPSGNTVEDHSLITVDGARYQRAKIASDDVMVPALQEKEVIV